MERNGHRRGGRSKLSRPGGGGDEGGSRPDNVSLCTGAAIVPGSAADYISLSGNKEYARPRHGGRAGDSAPAAHRTGFAPGALAGHTHHRLREVEVMR